MWPAVLAGLVWSQASVALELLVLPRYVALSNRVTEGWCYRSAHATLLAPLSLAVRVASARPGPATPGALAAPSLVALLLCPLFGVGLCLLARHALAAEKWRGATAACLLGVGLIGVVCCAGLTWQLREAVRAETTFFALVSRVDAAHEDTSTVSAARSFARRYPDSRWAGEALRIVAMAEWDAGRFEAASRLWSEFSERFSDRSAPGVAYAEYSLALCDERLGRVHDAERHLRAAVEVIRSRSDGIQGWIATEAAADLSSYERAQGRFALAGYWKTESQTFKDVYSNR